MGFDAFDDSGFGALVDSGFDARREPETVEEGAIIEIWVNNTQVNVITHGDNTALYDSGTEIFLQNKSGIDDTTASFSSDFFSDTDTYSSDAPGWPSVATPLGHTRTIYSGGAESRRYIRATIRETGGGADLRDEQVGTVVASPDHSHTVHIPGWYMWEVATGDADYGQGANLFACLDEASHLTEEDRVRIDGHTATGNSSQNLEWANPFTRGTLNIGDAFTFSIVPWGDGSERLDFDNESVVLKSRTVTKCFQRTCPGINGLGGTSAFWQGCDIVYAHVDSNIEIDDRIDFRVKYRDDVDNSGLWSEDTNQPNLIQFRDAAGTVL